jgi:hypothetical protein
MKKLLLCGIAAIAPALPFPAAASCGSAFCTTNTSWDVQGAWQEPGARFDLRYEYIKQDQPMSGSRKIGVGEIRRHHDEVETVNRNWLPGVDYTINSDWAVNAVLPIVHREHLHIHNHGGGQIPETWNFSGLGDARILARRRLATFEDSAPSVGTLGANLGLKLPTGRTTVRNPGGELAERSMQPGSGTTDLIAGLYYAKSSPMSNLSWFAQGLLQQPLDYYQEYRPGRRLTLDTGVRYQAAEKLGLMLQLNALVRARDAGAEAEPEDTGGRSLFLSPGVSYALADNLQVYGFVQLPLYQYVNGVQLTARHAFAVGISTHF